MSFERCSVALHQQQTAAVNPMGEKEAGLNFVFLILHL
jgi:hypothetical protein